MVEKKKKSNLFLQIKCSPVILRNMSIYVLLYCSPMMLDSPDSLSPLLTSTHAEHLDSIRAAPQELKVEPRYSRRLYSFREPRRIFLGTRPHLHGCLHPFPAGINVDDSDSIKIPFEMSFGGFAWVRETIKERCGPHVIS